ncbi:NAD kinase [Aurantiacibacter gilvus]|uniref:NAD kinase n=1 Tax=Aurantiacibacter gilvus TaxID=3139141 RepID=A0ABU9ICF1_9SPHN
MVCDVLNFEKLALTYSQSDRARKAAKELCERYDFVPVEQADVIIALGGDGTMLDALHDMLDVDRILPVFGINLGTVGFLMNRYHGSNGLIERLTEAKKMPVAPLKMEVITQKGDRHYAYAVNEVSLLRETFQTAKLEVSVNGRVRIAELAGDGILLSTPVGSTAYNLSANGPILPLDSRMLALTPISPFRPRRWRGAILPEKSRVSFRVNEPAKRPVAAVADSKEVRDVAEVHIEIARDKEMCLLFDPHQTLDERMLAEQFVT